MRSEPSYLTRFERKSAPISWSADELSRAIVPQICIGPFVAAAYAEGDVRREVAKARRSGLLRDKNLAKFFDLWIAEEDEHANAFTSLAESQEWPALDPNRRFGALERSRGVLSPVGLHLCRLVPATPQVFLGVGAAAEFVTKVLYDSMARIVTDPYLADLLRRVSRQEARHEAFFVAAARDQPTPRTVQRAAIRRLLARAWNPVGMDRLGRDMWLESFAPLMRQPDVRRKLMRMDRMLNAIPTFEDLHLMENFLESAEF